MLALKRYAVYLIFFFYTMLEALLPKAHLKGVERRKL